MKRLLIIEDEEGIAESLVDYFHQHEFLVSHRPTAEAAESLLGEERYSLILLDLLLPGRSGLEFLSRLRQRPDRTPVIIITARGEEAQRIRGLEAGADDYVVKPFSVHELLARVRAVLRRASGAPAQITVGERQIDFDRRVVIAGEKEHPLREKEAELLAFLYKHRGQSFRREELLREIWGYEEMPTTRTVDTHVFKLRQRIESRPDTPRYLLTVHGVGYIFAAE